MVTITIPAEHIDAARAALCSEIQEARLQDENPADLPGSIEILNRDIRLLAQLADTTEDTTLEAEDDHRSAPALHLVEEMVRATVSGLEERCRFSPLPASEMVELADRLQWALREAVRLDRPLEAVT